MTTNHRFTSALEWAFDSIDQRLLNRNTDLFPEEVGRIVFIGNGTARVEGLPGARAHELLRFPGDRYGLAFNLDPDEIGVILFCEVQSFHISLERLHDLAFFFCGQGGNECLNLV